ncbi:iron uptake porin [Leptolyngbya sp. FACHB-261]|uniref:iron uptake porin n=1 Tax=Leptolyngbya sp. FACHB-261 TaxID=2692806 RepID=UPI001688B5C9|nr:iron uptake porin [Leptolyngbya sp. FACHB-261]MBD2100136.1 iron uptake porin [Leptolyngbya sp. FACHB-261]
MSKTFWNSLLATPAILATAWIVADAPAAQAQKTQRSQSVQETIAQISEYSTGSPQASELATTEQEQLTSVSQLSDVKPTDWAFEALRSLVERYGCIVGYPDSTYRGNRALTRYEFAAGLNACLDRVNDLIATGTSNLASREDLITLQRLQEEFAAELATLRGRVDSLEARTAELEANQFSTTTKLTGEAVFSFSGLAGDDVDSNIVFQDRVRLNFNTSFNGRDLLRTRLTAGNAERFLTPGSLDAIDRGTAEGVLATRIGALTGNGIELERLSYAFPVGERLQAFIAARGIHSDYVFSTINPFFEDFDGGNGAISAFGQESPIYRIGGGSGIGLNFAFDSERRFVFTAGYLAENAALATGSNGLFNGDYAALGQLTFTPTKTVQIGLTYVHGYHTSGNFIFDIGNGNEFVTGTVPANALHTALNTSAVTNSYGLQASWQITPRFVLNAFGGYTSLTLLNRGDSDIWYYGLGLALPDLFKEGNLGGVLVGVEPYLGSPNIGGVQGLTNDTSLHIEAFYKHQLTDNISITPGLIWVTAPEQNSNNADYVVGTLRTTFTF